MKWSTRLRRTGWIRKRNRSQPLHRSIGQMTSNRCSDDSQAIQAFPSAMGVSRMSIRVTVDATPAAFPSYLRSRKFMALWLMSIPQPRPGVAAVFSERTEGPRRVKEFLQLDRSTVHSLEPTCSLADSSANFDAIHCLLLGAYLCQKDPSVPSCWGSGCLPQLRCWTRASEVVASHRALRKPSPTALPCAMPPKAGIQSITCGGSPQTFQYGPHGQVRPLAPCLLSVQHMPRTHGQLVGRLVQGRRCATHAQQTSFLTPERVFGAACAKRTSQHHLHDSHARADGLDV